MLVKIKGARVATGKGKGNKYITAVIDGKATQITFPNSVPVASGELIVGEVECGEKTYDTNADGTKMATPFTRLEVTSYLSKRDQLEIKKMNAEAYQVDNNLKTQYNLSDAQVAALGEW